MKKFLALIGAVALLSINVFADGITLLSVTAGGVSNLLSGSYLVQNLTVINTSTNLATVKFWNSSTNTTNIVRAAYTNWTGYATNYDVVFTNEAQVVVTNTRSGWFTAPTGVAAVTNSMPVLYTIAAPAGQVVSKDITMLLSAGLTVVSDNALSVAVTYKGNP